ncbi:hypothetical protein ACOMHN_021836 [Nucella lapillus]
MIILPELKTSAPRMLKSIVFTLMAVALAVVLFTPESAEGWGIRRGWRRFTHKVRRVFHGRSVKVAAPLTEDDLAKLTAVLAAPCPQKADAMTAELASKFDDLDANGDGALDDAELDSFNNFLKTYNGCAKQLDFMNDQTTDSP